MSRAYGVISKIIACVCHVTRLVKMVESLTMLRFVVCFVVLLSFIIAKIECRSFSIDYANNCFTKDGEPFRYISGSFHYFRVPSYYWKDRLLKLKAAGLNTVQTYVAWNFHEAVQGKYNFDGDADLVSFINLANSLGLLVIVRAGPYICAEWEFGGFPGWLLKNPHIVLRSSKDKSYISAVDSWMGVLLPKLKPLLYANGGPIVAVQVENEYGSYVACDHDYMTHLEQLFRLHLGNDVILFTTDGDAAALLKCGTIPSLYATVDFGPGTDPSAAFAVQRQFSPKGPLVNSEYYTGWLDLWGEPHQERNQQIVAQYLDKILAMNASVNLYMFEVCTNFGFMNGATFSSRYQPVPTSYDYDAPLTEAGDPTEKYFTLRTTIAKYNKPPAIPIPPATPKYNYGTVEMTEMSPLLEFVQQLTPLGPVENVQPLTMEQLGQNYGFVLYRTELPLVMAQSTRMLNVTGLVHDRAIVFVGKIRQATLNRTNGQSNASLVIGEELELDILVENMGRVNFGSAILDPKGLLGNVTLDGYQLFNWKMYPLELDLVVSNNSQYRKVHGNSVVENLGFDNGFAPTFFHGELPSAPFASARFDSYLKLDGWTKGQAYVNGFNLGRYWPEAGPQKTLFVPANVLRPDQKPNSVVLLELDDAPCDYPEKCFVEFVTTPNINGTVLPIYVDRLVKSHKQKKN